MEAFRQATAWIGKTPRLLLQCLAIFVFVATLFIATPTPRAEAQIPFGGMSGSVFWCNCSFNLMVTVGPPVGGVYMYQPGGTILYMFGQIYRAGVWLLGLAGGVSQCLIIIPHGCAVVGAGPQMIMVGTSM